MSDWLRDQEWERVWHGHCQNSLNEELKQLVYARKMGLQMSGNDKTPYSFNLGGKKILDIGGGAYSLLLKCENYSHAVVVDPCDYPEWIYKRYETVKITSVKSAGETFYLQDVFDECWIYNVLQHVMNPQKVIENALKHSKLVRIFEWIENGISPGHPNNLLKEELDAWLNGNGKKEFINESGCVGKCYYGLFKGQHYGT